MRPPWRRWLAGLALLPGIGVTAWLLLLGARDAPVAAALLVGAWPIVALPFALAGRAWVVAGLFVPYAGLSMLFGLGLGGAHFALGLPGHLLAIAAMSRERIGARRALAAALAAFALLVGVVLAAMTYSCGVTSVPEERPGEPAPAARCVSRLHPASFAIGAGAIAALVGIALGRAEPALVGGVALSALGVLLVFSAGVFPWLAGIALAAAGMVMGTREGVAPRRADDGRPS